MARFPLLAASLAALTSSSSVPQVERSASYPKRSSADSALLEWGNSAIIHNADGVVARFGPAATHPEFELGIEADLVTASPRQGCEALSNAAKALTQIVVMYRGGCSFRKKLENAEAAGAAALIVVNNDRRSPDRAFAMSLDADEEVDRPDDGPDPDQDAKIRTPSLMVSYAAGQQFREHGPRRMRIFAGGDRPFIESVTDAAPSALLGPQRDHGLGDRGGQSEISTLSTTAPAGPVERGAHPPRDAVARRFEGCPAHGVL